MTGFGPTHQVIALSAGAVEFTWPETLTELTSRDISSDPVVMSIGSQSNPTAFSGWVTPDLISTGTINAKEFMLANPSVPGVIVPDGVDPATVILHWVRAQLLIGALTAQHPAISPAAGSCYPYLKITDSPEIVPRRGALITIT